MTECLLLIEITDIIAKRSAFVSVAAERSWLETSKTFQPASLPFWKI
jgi:hypothetical protein